MQMAYSNCCLNAPFDVIVNYGEDDSLSITIDKADITKQFTTTETKIDIANDNQNILIGTFVVTVTSATLDSFDVIAFTRPEYTYNSDQFQALTNNPDQSNCRLALFSDKIPDGSQETYTLFNNAVVISHTADSGREEQITITAYILPGQISSISDSTCEMPIFLEIVGI
jgi:hypothetical protein